MQHGRFVNCAGVSEDESQSSTDSENSKLFIDERQTNIDCEDEHERSIGEIFQVESSRLNTTGNTVSEHLSESSFDETSRTSQQTRLSTDCSSNSGKD